MRISISKPLLRTFLGLLLQVLIGNDLVFAQQDRRNLRLGLDAGTSGGSALLSESRDLLGMVINSAAGSTIGAELQFKKGSLPRYPPILDELIQFLDLNTEWTNLFLGPDLMPIRNIQHLSPND